MAAAPANGGSVVVPPFPTQFGRMAALTDPAGALFWLAETDGSDISDRSG